jgi:hypothetical protein
MSADYDAWRTARPDRFRERTHERAREAYMFTSTEVVYGVTGTDVTELPEYGVSP